MKTFKWIQDLAFWIDPSSAVIDVVIWAVFYLTLTKPLKLAPIFEFQILTYPGISLTLLDKKLVYNATGRSDTTLVYLGSIHKYTVGLNSTYYSKNLWYLLWILLKIQIQGQFWNLHVLRIPKHPLKVEIDEVLPEIFEVKDKLYNFQNLQ